MARIKVDFLGPIGLDGREFEVETLKELRDALGEIAELRPWLELSAVAINDEVIEELDYYFKDNDRIVLLPPVCGG